MEAGNDLIVLQNKSSNDTVELAHHDTLVRLVARVGSRAISRVGSAPREGRLLKRGGTHAVRAWSSEVGHSPHLFFFS